MLRTFLEDETRRMNIALYPGVQEHLELFRTFLSGFYAMRFGHYPPQIAIFDANVLREMRNDFEALYEFLRDESLEISETTQFSSKSGISPLLSIKSFDLRYNHIALAYPLPLLPDLPRRKSSSWWNGPTKTSRSRRASGLVALSKATNSHHQDVIQNHLVSAYRRFEEDQISFPIAAGKLESPGPVDGRKIRWVLIYAIYQTLRRATEVAEEILDSTGVPYHLCISTTGLPPWESRQLVESFAHHELDRGSLPRSRLSLPSSGTKADNDDSVSANQATWNKKKLGNTVFKGNFSFSGSISRRSSALWRSLILPAKHESAQSPSYHEADGDGASTEVEDEKLAAEMSSTNLDRLPRERPISWVPDSPSGYSHSEARTSGTSETYVSRGSPKSPIESWKSERASLCSQLGLHDVNYGMSPSKWSKSLRVDECEYRTIRPHSESPAAPPTRRRPTSVYEDPRNPLQPAPLKIYKTEENPATDLNIQMPSPQAPTAWDYIQGVMEIQARTFESHVETEWNQSTDPGRLDQSRPDTPMPASTYRRASAMF